MGWTAALQVEVQQPIPIYIKHRNGTTNETVQLMGWMPETLCRNMMVLTATDYWWYSFLLGLFGFCIALLVLGCSLHCICGTWMQNANMLTTQAPLPEELTQRMWGGRAMLGWGVGSIHCSATTCDKGLPGVLLARRNVYCFGNGL